MNLVIGRAAVVLGLVGAVFGALVIVIGLYRDSGVIRRSARGYAWLTLGGAVVAAVAMERAPDHP